MEAMQPSDVFDAINAPDNAPDNALVPGLNMSPIFHV